jgi:hypothetical protein
MKKILNIKGWLIIASFTSLVSCDKGFEEMNVNPDASTMIVPAYVFTKAQYDALNNSAYSTYEAGTGGAMQHFATYKDVPALGDKYFFSQGTYPYDYFNNSYPLAVNGITEVIKAIAQDSSMVNQYAIARIWRAQIFQRLTDLYGDIPYFDAAKGRDLIISPKYDAQQSIYLDLLKELDESAAALDPAKASFGNADLIYTGNVAQWKKFAYSLMFRLAMRLTKVDVTSAETWAKKAIVGGLILADADLAKVPYVAGGQDINKNPVSLALRNNNYGVANGNSNTEGGKFAKTFIDYLRDNNDPRLNSISVVWVNGAQDTSTAIQKGMPNGLLQKPADFVNYSEPNINTVFKFDAPFIVLGNAEMNFLMAEAIIRGWATGDAASYYAAGVAASMRSMSLYGSAAEIATERINKYLSAHPLASTMEEQMKQIHTQMWVSLFPNEIEVFSNWRRTGYPVLTPVNITGNATNGVIPRRLLYPPSEESLNGINYTEALKRQGENLFTTRVWWDK